MPRSPRMRRTSTVCWLPHALANILLRCASMLLATRTPTVIRATARAPCGAGETGSSTRSIATLASIAITAPRRRADPWRKSFVWNTWRTGLKPPPRSGSASRWGARCHDHKFDPLSQKEYYQFFAYFNNVQEKGMVWNFGNEDPLIPAPTREQELQLEELASDLAKAQSEWLALDARIQQEQLEWERGLVGDPTADWAPEQGLAAYAPRRPAPGPIVHRRLDRRPAQAGGRGDRLRRRPRWQGCSLRRHQVHRSWQDRSLQLPRSTERRRLDLSHKRQ